MIQGNDELYEKIKQKLSNRITNTNFIKHIDVFESLYQTLSVRTTAKYLNLSVGSISNSLTKLENTIEKPLFQRCGRSGLKVLPVGIEFHSIGIKLKELINLMVSEMALKNNNTNKYIKIDTHPLFLSVYMDKIVESIKKIDKSSVKIVLNISDREICLKKLHSNDTDLCIFPTEARDLSAMNGFFDIHQLRPYHLTLYMNKKNKFSTIDNHSLTWQDLGKLNIMPYNKNSRLATAQLMMQDFTNYSYDFATNTFDLTLLYNGIKNNLWSVVIGEEFEEVFDCKDFAIKRQDRITNIQYSANWFGIYKKTNQKSDILKNIIDNIKELIND